LKNYVFESNESKKFILKYKIDGNNIIIYLANGEVEVIDNNIDNEKTIIELMNKQARDKSKKHDINFNLISLGIVLGSIIFSFIYLIFVKSIFYNFIAGICFGGVISYLLTRLIPIFLENIKIKLDMIKNKFYFNNATLLNSNINKEKILTKVSDKTVKVIKNIDKDKLVFDINTIDKMPLRDLKKIKRNVELELNLNNKKVKRRVLKK